MQIVKDLMIPLEAYTRVAEEASLYEAVEALSNALFGPAADPSQARHRAVVVQAADGRVLGKLSLWDVLRGLEPRYGMPFDPLVVLDDYFIWTHALFANLGSRARSIRVKELLRGHAREEFIDENAPLDQAVHQLVQSRLPSLLVTQGERVTGILRLGDVFQTVSGMILATEAQPA